ncbi:MmgE/PrpD family protein [Kribbella sp. NPDC050124]|uniref:MmgE/PrpD family protein n=1 Tax=Kribbella sp. NPDC050124 TaxID=3364114 RepID=UPI00379318E8
MDDMTRIVGHVMTPTFEDIPRQAIERAKLSILDTLASAIGGSDDPIAHSVRRLGGLSGGKQECTIWVTGEKLPVLSAALVNSATSRVLDFDETYEIYINGCHASAYDVPPALVLAERDPSISGAELLAAVATAIDLHLRLARSITSNCGDTGRDNLVAVWGAAAACTRLLRLNEEQTRNAFGIAYAHAAGERQMYEEVTHVVALQQGLRARSGMESAFAASVGLNGPHEPLFGKYGFYRAFEPDHDLESLLDGLGDEYLNASISFKPWPSCRATHRGISGILELRERHDFQGDDIEAIEMGLNRHAESLVVQPRDQKWNPRDSVTARFSLPYVVAVAAAKGTVGIGDLRPEAFDDPSVRRIMAATTVEIDPEITRLNARRGNSPTRVKAILKDGAEHEVVVDTPFGHPDNPASLSDAMRKLESCAEMAARPFTGLQIEAIGDFVTNLDAAPSVAPLFELLAPSTSTGRA